MHKDFNGSSLADSSTKTIHAAKSLVVSKPITISFEREGK